jgi:hypothetical protein
MSGSSLLVAVNALLLKRLRLPAAGASGGDAGATDHSLADLAARGQE